MMLDLPVDVVLVGRCAVDVVWTRLRTLARVCGLESQAFVRSQTLVVVLLESRQLARRQTICEVVVSAASRAGSFFTADGPA